MARQIIFYGDYFVDFYKDLGDKVKDKVKYVWSTNQTFIGYFVVLTKDNWLFCSMDFRKRLKKRQKMKLIGL